MMSQIDQTHPAEGKDDAAESGSHEQEGQEVAVIPLQQAR